MNTHRLKTWPEYYSEIIHGIKTFEIRKNDRDFHVGDDLILMEWDPATEKPTGRVCKVQITYILKGGNFGLQDGYCAMSFSIAYHETPQNYKSPSL